MPTDTGRCRMSERIDYEALIARVDGWYNITSQNREDLLAALRHAATVEQAAENIDPDFLPYERVDDEALMQAVRLREGEHLLVLRPFGWHLDGHHIPNAAEHFSRRGVCEEHRWQVVCDYGPYIAIVRAALDAALASHPPKEGTK